MVMVKDNQGCSYSMDGFLYNSLFSAKKVMKSKDLDLIIQITGYPGTGKSTLACQIACFLDPSFNEERLCLTAEKFINEIKKATAGQCVVLDESYEGLNSSEIRKEVGRALLNLLNVVRQKRLYILILIPNFFDMSKQIACFRSRWLIHCYDKGFGDIGYYCLFDRKRKHDLWIRGKKYEDYESVRADFYCSFSPFIPKQINYEKYLENKAQALQDIGTKEILSSSITQRNKLIIYMFKVLEISIKEISTIVDLDIRTLQRITHDFIHSSNNKDSEYKEMILREINNPLINKRFPLKKNEKEC
jgi:tRNA uridine 5-carbamoylmethylation protein Kti12